MDDKLLKILTMNAAQKYAHEKKVSIRNVKSLRGTTLLYHAFLAGIEFYKSIVKT